MELLMLEYEQELLEHHKIIGLDHVEIHEVQGLAQNKPF